VQINYNKKKLIGDIYGGTTAAIIALPLALAFGVASGAGAEAGLYGAIILGLIAAAFGGTAVQISGPTGPMTVITASAIAIYPSEPAKIFGIIALGGLIQMILGFLKVGKLVRYIPYPVISGFMTGIGIIIIVLQVHPLLGIEGFSSPIAAVRHLGTLFTEFKVSDSILGIVTLLIVFFVPKRISRILPSPLIALLGCSAAAYFMGMHVTTIGHIPSELPAFKMPEIDMKGLSMFVTTGISLAVLGSIDSLLTSLVADSLTKTNHKPNQELIAQGFGNMMASFFGGLPGAGATMRTVVNVKAGGSTRVSGIIHGLILLLILIILGPAAENIPLAVLSGILIKVGFDIVDYRFLKLVKMAPKHDTTVMTVVLVLTVFVDLIVAVGAGVVLASLLLTYRITKQTESVIHEVDVKIDSKELERQVQESTKYKIRVIDINGPFFFGTTTQIVGKIGQYLGTKIVIFNCIDVPFMDYSAVFALSEKVTKLKSNNVTVFIIFNERLKQKFLKLNMEDLLPEKHIFANLELAVEHAKDHLTRL